MGNFGNDGSLRGSTMVFGGVKRGNPDFQGIATFFRLWVQREGTEGVSAQFARSALKHLDIFWARSHGLQPGQQIRGRAVLNASAIWRKMFRRASSAKYGGSPRNGEITVRRKRSRGDVERTPSRRRSSVPRSTSQIRAVQYPETVMQPHCPQRPHGHRAHGHDGVLECCPNPMPRDVMGVHGIVCYLTGGEHWC